MNAETMWRLAWSIDLLVVLVLAALSAGCMRLLSIRKPWLVSLPLWLVRWSLIVLLIRLALSGLGGVLFLLVGALSHPHLSVSLRVSYGIVDGFLYSVVWAYGVSIVACVMMAHHRTLKLRKPDPGHAD